jgi:hypothetical protein
MEAIGQFGGKPTVLAALSVAFRIPVPLSSHASVTATRWGSLTATRWGLRFCFGGVLPRRRRR